MATVTVRNIPDEVHRALRLRAAEHGRSTEAEIRDILARSVCPEERIEVGNELRRFFEQFPEFAEIDVKRDPSPADAADFP
ncbi:FitA-like ribbon-helix-helix domain-containing protein [Plasticicumulans sp.]|uniref:FitA-like ribbon-helix-helix domain-containing protein n=1 Tax=Plasticicumulans sp. TaxID=2307179 RepID=UPI002BE7DAA1|nr:Arc family DNA-binding protein [Plasticicumulans sp.]MBS0600792.1 Arc family DNA-binding protein [Pseudomonadota bacterium]HMV39401.1 Arc family DNA-binding protein [Plasticicumulans sp.]HMW28980.1 Arc family DNA-binding protein [Plasticicumulans sp.]HMW43273.1 Arc family DNA-binding protein [Plasticicumulans sp.]HMX54240.1 Arc family DNA-binding protein [Plasticicumulans sp.]